MHRRRLVIEQRKDDIPQSRIKGMPRSSPFQTPHEVQSWTHAYLVEDWCSFHGIWLALIRVTVSACHAPIHAIMQQHIRRQPNKNTCALVKSDHSNPAYLTNPYMQSQFSKQKMQSSALWWAGAWVGTSLQRMSRDFCIRASWSAWAQAGKTCVHICMRTYHVVP